MFNLEKSILAWQQQMLVAGIKTPVPLEELEIHLREEIERQMKSGLNDQNAFEISVQRIGKPQPLKSEFKKIERQFMKTMKIVGGIVGVMIGAALMVPGSIQLHDELVVVNSKLGLWLLGWALVGGSVIFLQRMFLPKLFKVESEKVELTPMKQTVKIGAGMLVLLIGMAFMMPTATQAVHEGVIKYEAICLLVLGIALLISGAVVTFCPYKKRTA